MSPPERDERGTARVWRSLPLPPGYARVEEDCRGANQAKTEKLRRSSLQRRARARGFELRHSAYGYALIDASRNRVDARRDMNLDEVESLLDRAPER